MFDKKNQFFDVRTFLSKIFLSFKKILSFIKKYRETNKSTSENVIKSENETYKGSDISEAINKAFDDKQESETLNTIDLNRLENNEIKEKNDDLLTSYFLANPSSIFLAVWAKICFTCLQFKSGLASSINAMAPLTMGAANDVPTAPAV